MKTKISAEIVVHSKNPEGDKLITFLVTFPRIILAEVNTHRMFSRNTSSSRAIPFDKMVESVKENPFVPIAWQKPHKGMQGHEYVTDPNEISLLRAIWLKSRNNTIESAKKLHEPLGNLPTGNTSVGVTKQLCNRLLEPFMWTTMLITTGKEGLENFFELRRPQYQFSDTDPVFKSKKDYCKYHKVEDMGDFYTWATFNKSQAEIHIQALAEAMYDAYNGSEPKKLREGDKL